MQYRFEDSPDLFGRGCGSGTSGEQTCEWCGTTYNKGADEEEIYDGDSVTWTLFADKEICDCCFGKIEEEVWRRRKDLLPWIRARLEAMEEQVAKDMGLLEEAECDS